MTMFDLSNVLNSAKQVKTEEAERDQNKKNRMKLLYPGEGTVRVRVLFNPASNIALRKVGRHNVNGVKVPCMQMYGQECAVCKTLSEIKSVKGTDMWQYSRKDRGISYAQYIDDTYDRTGEKQDDIPKNGEIIKLMYPWSVFRDLSAIIADAGPASSTILASNKGKIVKITREKKKDRVEYRVELDAFNEFQTAEDDNKFAELLNGLPNLNDEICPAQPTEQVVNTVNEVKAKLIESYLSPSVLGVNPGGSAVNLGNFAGQQPAQDPNIPAWAQAMPSTGQPTMGQPNMGQANFGQPQSNVGQAQFNQNTQFTQPNFNNQPMNQQPGFTPNTNQTPNFNQGMSQTQQMNTVQQPQGQASSSQSNPNFGGQTSDNPWAGTDLGSDDGVSPS